MIEIRNDELVFSFPEVHRQARLSIGFQRTLRLPDDNREYPLPPGLGGFPLRHVDDHADRVPAKWKARGGVLLPMYQAEALWLCFEGGGFRGGRSDYPFAVKVAAGKINAVTGDPWKDPLQRTPQDYMVVPGQPWLDGFAVAKGKVRQFVAMPLGQGYTAEEQLTGEAEFGGIQIIAYPMRREAYEKRIADHRMAVGCNLDMACHSAESLMDMGLAPGGLMRQEIYQDEFDFSVWDAQTSSRCFVHIVNSLHYRTITGEDPPHGAPTAADYTSAGLPWFDYYGGDKVAVDGAKTLAGLDSVAALGIKKGNSPLPENEAVSPKTIVILGDKRPVREGEF